MKRLILSLIIATSSILGAMAGSLDERADSAYASDNFTEAEALYRQAINEYGASAKLYYNLGNASYRNGKQGEAVLNYERALRLDPTDEKARANLNFVNSKLIDKPGERGTFLGNAMDSIALSAHADTWAWIALLLFALFIAGTLAYFFASAILLRKIGFFGGILLLILSVCALIISSHAQSISQSKDYAVITAPSTILSTTPRAPKNRTEEAMLLHEGTKVNILDSVASKSDSVQVMWYDVKVDNEHRAWISSRDVEII
ncbi:MAG: tetratricopeptide repeat protein [Muribaculaceae bacterium]|nr:tetratricopeptide repeat protein [Muribaculaceae bacterium]